MRTIIFGNKFRNEVAGYTATLIKALKRYDDVSIIVEDDFLQFLKDHNVSTDDIDETVNGTDFSADTAFSIGGDGTFIRSSAKIGKKRIPIIGINAGRLGFLADVDGNDIDKAVEYLFAGRCHIEERAWLRLYTEDHSYTDFNYALNEIAVLKQDSSAMITIHTWVNGEFLNSYQADGLLISTSTGSTAYSMSVGGPIVVPQANDFIITPVAPHSLNMRPLIIPDAWEIEIVVESRNKHFLIALDGRNNVFDEKTKLMIKKAAFTTKVIRLEDQNFFHTLRSKLMWGSGTRK